MSKFNYVSLFSGIGGFEQALNKLGGNCVLASEIDKFANQAYEVLYGEPTAGDITQLDAMDIPDHDLLVGGFPCQAFSVAGKRLGFDDTRGTLFFEVARIAKEKKPKAILLENVKGLVGHDKGKTLDTIVQTLNDIGYTVDFEVLNSKYFGVPQNRERIFIIAVHDDLIEAEPWTIAGNTVVPKGKRRISGYTGEDAWELKTFNFDWPPQESVDTRLRDILETEVDEKYYLDDEKTAKLVAQLDDSSGEPVIFDVSQVGHEGKARIYKGVSPTISAREYKEPRMDGSYEGLLIRKSMKRDYAIAEEILPVLTPDRLEKRQNGRRFKEDGEEMFTITAQDRHGIAIKLHAKHPNERMSRQAIETFNDSSQPKEHGDMIQAYNRQHLKDGICPTLTTRPEGFKTASLPVVASEPPRYRIRKLTPKECFRLQAFTDEAHDALEAAGISNSQRYKMAGNAVTVSVIEAIGERLIRFL